MTKRVMAPLINPELLVWARKSAGFSLEEAAAKLGIDPDRLAVWEQGRETLSIPQLRKAAETYKRPLALFYLPEPPLSFLPMHDFRRLPDVGPRRFSPGLMLEIRLAHQRRAFALELLEASGELRPPFDLTTTLETNVDLVAKRIRTVLGVDHALQTHWRDPLVAFRAWRSRIEELGVLVFQASRVESAEASGFAFWADALPFMVVNRKDTHARRIFSLIHELAHLMLHQSGVSDADEDGQRSRADEQVEVFCNKVAAATLMPRDRFLADPVVTARGVGLHEWTDEEIKALSLTYGVSREAVARRLNTLSRASDVFYKGKRRQYGEEYRAQKLREKERNADNPTPRNMPRETIADFGRPFVRMVLESYHRERLSIADVSGHLGVKVRHLPDIERQVGLS